MQLSVRSTAIKDVSIWSISNPSLNIQFERRAGSALTLDSWVDVNSLDEANPIPEVCKRGFAVQDAANGLEFNVGNIKFPENGQSESLEALRCIVCGGLWSPRTATFGSNCPRSVERTASCISALRVDISDLSICSSCASSSLQLNTSSYCAVFQ